MTNPLIGMRLKALRDEHGVNQDVVARILSFKDRQTVSAIENGERRMRPDEIIALANHFCVDSEYFTDPFRLVGEGCFNWRQSYCSPEGLKGYQERAGRWLAAFRALSSSEERPGPRERLSLKLWEKSPFELAMAEGERLARDYQMGEVPALRLPEVMENDFGILVLMVDMDNGISGAACRLPELDAVFVNRNENPGRRNFDLAHEFFHILTWDQMRPAKVETSNECGGSRIEQLANNFASALLMPRRLLERFGDWRRLGNTERALQMRKVADHFRVSVTALHWRLVVLKFLGKAAEMVEVPNGATERTRDAPPLFSRGFMHVMARAIEQGLISVSKLTKVLETPRDSLRATFDAHGITAPVTV